MKHGLINRSLVLVLPKQPALDWIRRVDPEPDDSLTLAELRLEQEVYLLPEGLINSLEQAQQWALENFSTLFASFLYGWFSDQSKWPAHRTRQRFEEWFEVQFHTMVWDLATGPLEREAYIVPLS